MEILYLQHLEAKGRNKSSRKAKEPPSPLPPLKFDFEDAPEKVSWCMENAGEEAWTPFVGDGKVQDSVIRDWCTAFTVITTKNPSRWFTRWRFFLGLHDMIASIERLTEMVVGLFWLGDVLLHMILVKLYCNMLMGSAYLCLPLTSYGHHFLTSKRWRLYSVTKLFFSDMELFNFQLSCTFVSTKC